jgi:subtilase family serine protease
MLNRATAALFAVAGAVTLAATASAPADSTQVPPGQLIRRTIAAERHDVSPPLRDIPAIAPGVALRPDEREPATRRRARVSRALSFDTVVQNTLSGPNAPAPVLSFEGVSNVNSVLPPDTNGDVGPNHYVQWVNVSFAIYSKGSPPTRLYGPAAGNTIWSGFGGPCETRNDGDPIVRYDHLADRWVMSQLAIPNSFFGILFAPFYQCIAVSATSDPTGAYYRYQFAFDKLNDYPKLGVWPDGYYLTMNQYLPPLLEWGGQGVAVLDRASMLAGHAASMVYFDLAGVDTNLGGMLPSDLDGPPPPAGSPNYFVQMDDDAWGYADSDQLQLWQFHVDWSNPAASSFTRRMVLPTQPFDSDMCAGTRNCLSQPATAVRIDSMADRLMYRLQYRNFGDHESLVVNHTVDADGTDHAGIRWYEIRDPGTTPSIHQQGTYAPDADHRWMGSVALDGSSNLALGFSVVGPATYPSIRYTGRLADDAPGLLTQGEATLVAGAGAQTHSSGRWGDYSIMAVDPTDDCTFWYTQEYYSATSEMGWHTRIGAFSFPSCGSSQLPSVTVTPTDPTATETGPTSGTFTFTRNGSTTEPLTVAYSIAGSAAPDVDYVALPSSVTIPAGSTTQTLTVTAIDDGVYEPDETVALTITGGTTYRAGLPSSAIITIASDELPPDLIVSALTAPAVGGAGNTIAVNDTTKNQGGGSADASATAFYLSTNTTLDAADVSLSSRPVPVLLPGAFDARATTLTIPAATATGSFYVIAKADGNGALNESQEGNNTRASALIRIGPDLTVSTVSAPSVAAAGAAMTVGDTTSNTGGGSAGISTTRFYLSVNSTLDASDIALGGRSVGPIGPGGADAGTASVVVPATTVSGSYYVLAKADGDTAVAETQENNNVKLGPAVKVGPDLVITAISAPAAAGAGATVALTDTTKNQGGAGADTSTTTFYLSTNVSLDAADVPLGGRTVPPLGAGVVNSTSTSLVIPPATASGTYYVLATADGNNVVAESVETNNASAAALLRIGPDLTVTALSVPSSAGAGTTIVATDTTKNAGGGTAPETTTMFYLSTNISYDAADIPLGGRAVPSLTAGTANSGPASLAIPAGTAAGTYYVLARADGTNVIAESIETNNASSAVVLRVGPDLTIASLSAPATAAAGASISVVDTTRNAGGGAAPGSTTTFYFSTNTTLDAGDTPLGGRSVPPLGPGATSGGSTVVQIPAIASTGTYYVLAKADGNDQIPETAETNNVSFGAAVRVGPDLTVTLLTLPGTTVAAGATISISDTTANQGADAAPSSVTFYYLSTNVTLGGGDVLVGSRNVGPLAGAGNESGPGTVTIPAGTAAGTYYIVAVADGPGSLVETIETNNNRAASIRIGP